MDGITTQTVAAWQLAIGAWLTETGMDRVSTDAHLLHLQEEIEEYDEEITAYATTGDDTATAQAEDTLRRAGCELADMMFIVLGQAHLHGINLERAMKEKFALNKKRTPLPMGPDGLVRLSKPAKEQM